MPVRLLAASIAGALLALSAPASAAPPAWSVGAPIYEVNLQMFSQAGTYKELEKHLPRLKEQGVGILWLMPITTRGVQRAFGSPYCVKDYKGFHAPYGSAQDFRDLVAAVHRQGLHIILDWVPNHSAWDNPLITQHPEFYRKNPDGSIAQAYGWTDVAHLDYGNAALRTWMIEAMAYWVREYDVDGFRCDVAWGVPVDFWTQARAALDKVKPLFLLAENNDPAYQAAFDSDYDWNLLHVRPQTLLTDIASGAKPASALVEPLLKDQRDYAPGFMRMRFTSNHDEWKDFGTPFQRLKAGVRTFAVLTATLPGKPLIYNGQEIGWNPSDRNAPIAWNDTSAFRGFYRALLSAHREVPALHSGSFSRIRTDQEARVFAYHRRKEGSQAVVLLNLSGQAAEFTLDTLGQEGDYQDLFAGTPVKWYGNMTLQLAPWEYRVYVAGPRGTALRGPGLSRPAGRSCGRPFLSLDAQGRLMLSLPGRGPAGPGSAAGVLRFDALGKSPEPPRTGVRAPYTTR